MNPIKCGKIIKARRKPKSTVVEPEVRVMGLIGGFLNVRQGYGAEVPLAEDGVGMVGWEEFEGGGANVNALLVQCTS